MTKILFVCTGNVFRSASAEKALKTILSSDFEVASAGTQANQGVEMRSDVRDRITHWKGDPAGHEPRLLTQEMIDKSDLVIAMGTDHRDYIREKFNHEAVLFLEVAADRKEGIPDLWEIIPDYK